MRTAVAASTVLLALLAAGCGGSSNGTVGNSSPTPLTLPSLTPTSPPILSPSPVDTAQTCQRLQHDFNQGVDQITSTAKTSPLDAVTMLGDLAKTLTSDVANTTDAQLKQAVDQIAAEFNTIKSSFKAGQVPDLSKVEDAAKQLATICGTGFGSPSPTSVAPSIPAVPSPSPSAS